MAGQKRRLDDEDGGGGASSKAQQSKPRLEDKNPPPDNVAPNPSIEPAKSAADILLEVLDSAVKLSLTHASEAEEGKKR